MPAMQAHAAPPSYIRSDLNSHAGTHKGNVFGKISATLTPCQDVSVPLLQGRASHHRQLLPARADNLATLSTMECAMRPYGASADAAKPCVCCILVEQHRITKLTAARISSALLGQAWLTLPLKSLIYHGCQRMQPRASVLVSKGGATVHLVCSSSSSMPYKLT